MTRITGQDDIITAAIVSGRNHPDTEQVMGVFVNMLALRNHPKGEKHFRTFLQEVKQSTLKAFENRDYPFETLVEKLPGSRDISRHPLMDVGFTLQNTDANPITPGQTDGTELHLISLKSERKTARKDLNLEAFEAGEQLHFEFQYCSRLFREESIVTFTGYFKEIVSDVLENPGKRIKDINVLPEEEMNNIYAEIQKAKESIAVEFDI
jgi:non-ribosomal peptide synthetase component F